MFFVFPRFLRPAGMFFGRALFVRRMKSGARKSSAAWALAETVLPLFRPLFSFRRGMKRRYVYESQLEAGNGLCYNQTGATGAHISRFFVETAR